MGHAVRVRGPLCVGIDPHPELLRQWALTDDVWGVERFALAAVEALAPVVAVVSVPRPVPATVAVNVSPAELKTTG